MIHHLKILTIALLHGVVLSGCATIVNGTTQKIGIASTPTGAEVTIDYHQRVTTPASFELARDENHTFVFKKDGYQEEAIVVTSGTSGWVWGNLIAGGLVGGIVDLSTGGARKLSHDSVHVTLTPLPNAQTPTLAPSSAVGTTEPNTNSGQQEAQLLELKSLLDKGLITQEEYDQKRAAILGGI